MSKKIKKGDKVIILNGKYKGKKGLVIKIIKKKNKAIVKGINIIKKHIKKYNNTKGKIIKKEHPINISKISFFDPIKNKNTRIGFTIKNKKKLRISKISNKIL